MTSKKPKRLWIFALAITLAGVWLLLIFLGAGVSLTLQMTILTIALVWLSLIKEFANLDATQKKRYGFALALITTIVIVAGHLVQRRESRELQRELGPRALTEQQVNEWVGALVGHSGKAVDVIANGPTKESIDISRQFERVLQEAGWNVKWSRFWDPQSRGSFTSGILIEAKYRNGDPNGVLSAARLLYEVIHREFPDIRLVKMPRNHDRLQVLVFSEAVDLKISLKRDAFESNARS